MLASTTPEHGIDDIGHQDIGLGLASVPHHRQFGRVFTEPANEVETDSVRLASPDDVAEAKHAAREVE